MDIFHHSLHCIVKFTAITDNNYCIRRQVGVLSEEVQSHHHDLDMLVRTLRV